MLASNVGKSLINSDAKLRALLFFMSIDAITRDLLQEVKEAALKGAKSRIMKTVPFDIQWNGTTSSINGFNLYMELLGEEATRMEAWRCVDPIPLSSGLCISSGGVIGIETDGAKARKFEELFKSPHRKNLGII